MPGPFGSLLVVAFAASAFEAAAGADAEVAAGRAPVEVDGPEEESIAFTLVPGAGVRWTSGESALSLSYTPRIFYRLPNALSVERPLVLHQVSLDHATEPTRLVGWSSSAQLSVGELDYTAASVVFAPGQVVRTSVAEVLRTEGRSGVTVAMSRRTTWAFGVSGEYTTSLDDQVDAAPDGAEVELAQLGDSLPSSAGFSVDSGLRYLLSRDDEIGFGAEATYQWFEDSGRFLLLSPELSYSHKLGPNGIFAVAGGLAYIASLTAPGGLTDSDSLGGTGSVHFGSEVYESSGVVASTGITGSVEWFFDPIAGTSQPRAGVELGGNVSIGRDWEINPNAAFFAILRGSAIGGSEGLDAEDLLALEQTPDATLLSGELPFRYRLSPAASFTFGARAALRGRALGADGFRLDEQVELWGFVGLTVRASTRQADPVWLGL
jgi:hypothetical protein